MNDEDIKVLEELKISLSKNLERLNDRDISTTMFNIFSLRKQQAQAIENLLNRYQQYEQKLMFALSPTNHELALETQRNFKKIIMQNIDKDTYTIRKELKKYWDNMNTYWEGK